MKFHRTMTAFAVCMLLAACGGAEDRKTAYLNKGQALFDEGNFEKARLEFKNVLQIDPKDLKARYALAQTLEKLENWRGAARQYTAILSEKDDHRDALVRMGRLYLLSNNDDEARTNAEKILAGSPDDVEALTLLAAVEAKAGNRDLARETISRALEVEPLNPEAAALMSSLLLVEGRGEESVSLLEDAIAKHPDEVALKINLARVHAGLQRPDDAIAVFRQVIEQAPGVLVYRNAFARFLIGLKRLDEAERALKDAIAAFPGDPAPHLAYVEFLAANRSVDAAIDELNRVIGADPDELRYRFALGKVFEAATRLDEAAGTYTHIAETTGEGPDYLTAKSRLAVVKARQNDLASARALAEEVLADNPRDSDSLTLRGTLLLNDGDAPGAIADFRTVLRDAPANISVIRLLSRAHLTNKEPELAKDVLQQGLESNPGADILGLELANYHATRGDLDQALTRLDAILARSKGHMRALEGKFKILVYRKEWDAALAVSEQIKAAAPKSPTGYHFAGLIHQATGNVEASVGEFQSALDVSPLAVQPLSQLVKSYLALDQGEVATAKLNEVVANEPRHFVAYNLLGELHLRAQQFDQAKEQFERAVELNAGWPIPYRNLATTAIALDDGDTAVAWLKQGIEATGGSPLLVTGLASYLEKTGNLDSAIEQYENVLREKPDSALAANNLAMLLVEYREDQDSWRRARELVTPLRNTPQPAYLDTVGWVEYKLGEHAQAVLFLEKAVDAAPNAAIMRYHLGMAYLAQGNEVEARDQLSKAVESNVEFKGLEEARAALERLGAG
jgi:tetratricopeptide (TPR) repeat protein